MLRIFLPFQIHSLPAPPCPRRLTSLGFIRGTPCPLACCWVQPVGSPDWRWEGGKNNCQGVYSPGLVPVGWPQPDCIPYLKFTASFKVGFLLELSFQIWVTTFSLLSDVVLLFCVGLLNCPLIFFDTQLIPSNPFLNAPLIILIWVCQLFPAKILIWWTFSYSCFSLLVTVLLWTFWYKRSCGYREKLLQRIYPEERNSEL